MSQGASIIRRRLLPFERDYTQVPNAWMRDETISWQAKGLLVWLMTHEDGFTVSTKSITDAATNGRTTARTIVDELRQAGYLRVYDERDEQGKKRWVYQPCDPGERLPLPVDNSATNRVGIRHDLDNRVGIRHDNRVGNRTAIRRPQENNYPEQAPNVPSASAPVDRVPFYRGDRGAFLPDRLVFVEPCDHPTNRHRYSDRMGKCVDCDRTPTTRAAAEFHPSVIAARLSQSKPNNAGTEAAGAGPATDAGTRPEGASA